MVYTAINVPVLSYYRLLQPINNLSFSDLLQLVLKNNLQQACGYQVLINQVLITSFATNSLTTCKRPVVDKLSKAMRTYPDIGFLITSLLQPTSCNLPVFCFEINGDINMCLQVEITPCSVMFTTDLQRSTFTFTVRNLITSFCVILNIGSSEFTAESEQFFPLPTFSAAQSFPVTTFVDQTATNNTHSSGDMNALPGNVSCR